MTILVEGRPAGSTTATAGAATATRTRRAEFVLTLSCPE
ncbi:hypothetical protein RCH21_001029 [Arthrobacter sp. PL16]|nr:hypothetical protein [Arthrobacter sp. PL16]